MVVAGLQGGRIDWALTEIGIHVTASLATILCRIRDGSRARGIRLRNATEIPRPRLRGRACASKPPDQLILRRRLNASSSAARPAPSKARLEASGTLPTGCPPTSTPANANPES